MDTSQKDRAVADAHKWRERVPEATYVGGVRRKRVECVCGKGFRCKADYKAHYRAEHLRTSPTGVVVR